MQISGFTLMETFWIRQSDKKISFKFIHNFVCQHYFTFENLFFIDLLFCKIFYNKFDKVVFF